MTKAMLYLVALAVLAGCDASMTSSGPPDMMGDEEALPAEGADPPGAQGPNATPWWGVQG